MADIHIISQPTNCYLMLYLMLLILFSYIVYSRLSIRVPNEKKKSTLTFSMDFTTNGSVLTKNIRQNFFEWDLFEIWTMWFLDWVLGGPRKIFETPWKM